MSYLACRLEVVVPPEVGECLLGFQILDTIKNLLMCGIRISFEIPTFLIRTVKMLFINIKTTPYLVIVLVVLKRGLALSSGSTPSKLSTAVWVGWPGLSSLDPMGMLTHPGETSRRVRRHC